MLEISKNQLSEHAFLALFKKTNQRTKVAGNIPDALAKVVPGLISEWKKKL